ncbi:hypothetical protein ES288_A08G198200v1 [Gossypium darwinii]|uniref:RPN1 N-terminal domain-containing protein n=1 Tax=Gossypium darwinii TaxID=34276 RepID=A0A5D2FNI4_GOSDA|nr:hypothetical protein ES288_A08G198200v1 [Gossypium darwinii]
MAYLENGTETLQTKPLRKDTKKKDVNKEEDLHAQSEEDLALKQQLKLSVERIYDVDLEVQKIALESMRQEVRTLISSITYKYLANILSMLALTMSAETKQESLKYRLLGSEGNVCSWGHKYSEDAPADNLMELVEQISLKHMIYIQLHVDDLDILFMNIAYSIYFVFYEFSSALQIALFLNNLEVFTSCDDLLMKKQFCYILARQGINFELHDNMVEDDEGRELSQVIINNVKLSEGYLTLARDIEVMEPKCPEDVYKTHLLNGRTIAGANVDSIRQNLAATFVNTFVNAGFSKDRLMTDLADFSSKGMILLWNVDSRFAQIDKYLHSDDNYVIDGALLGAGLVNYSVTNDYDLILNSLTAILKHENVFHDLIVFTVISLGLVYVGSSNGEVAQEIADALTGRSVSELGQPIIRLLVLFLGLIYLGKQMINLSQNQKMRDYVDIILLSCAHAGTRNVLMVQKLLGHCSHLENTETSQGSAVLGIAKVAMVEEAVVISLGLIGAGTNNARIVGMLRNLLSFYYKVPSLLFCVRITQGLVHIGKGLLTLNPYHSDRLLCSSLLSFVITKIAVAGLVTILHACLDMKYIILGKYHFVLYYHFVSYVPFLPTVEGYVILIENTE